MTAITARRPLAVAFIIYALLAGAAADGGAPYALTLLLGAGAAVTGLILAATYEKEDE